MLLFVFLTCPEALKHQPYLHCNFHTVSVIDRFLAIIVDIAFVYPQTAEEYVGKFCHHKTSNNCRIFWC